jgi:hypothetical protein
MTARLRRFAYVSFALAVVTACVGDSSTSGTDASSDACSVGSEGCPCTSGGACNPGLSCESKVCVNLNVDSGPEAGPDAPNDAPADIVDAADESCQALNTNCSSNGQCCSNYCTAGLCKVMPVTD